MSTGMTPDERKLQPVYEDVSAGRYKAAESAVARHLKKNPKSQAALTLKFVLHERQGAAEATYLKSLRDARQGPMNARSLWWITTSLRSLKRLDLCLALHLDMWKQYPDSMEVGEQVFLCACAVWDTKVMAESSRKMFNGAKDEIWARLAAWAEWANKAPQPTTSQPYPPPAPEGSLKKASILLSTAGPSISTSDILWLKFQILLSSSEHKRCHELLLQHGQGGSLARDWYRMKGLEELAKRESGDTDWIWEKELGEYLDTWTNDDLAYRNYAYYQHSIAAAKALLATRPELVKRFIEKLDSLQEKYGTKERAPLLAKLELDLHLPSTDLAMSEDEWKKLVTEYWTRWGAKGSIVPELEAIVGDRTAWLQGLIEKRIAEGQTDEKSYRELVNANLYVLRRKPADWIPSEEEIKRYWQLYSDGLAYGNNLPHTDIQPADEMGLTTVQLILTTQSPSAPLRAILCLEYILSKSPSCAHAKFLLIRLYRLVGALSSVKSILEDLKASEVQLDTLLHVWIEGGATDAFLAPPPRGQEVSAWEKWTSMMERMYNRSATDLPEYMKQAIEHGSFSKIHSIRSLASTLAHSRTQAALTIEQTRYRLLNGDPAARALSELTTLKSREMEDSRNWELMPSIGGFRAPVNDLTRFSETGPGGLERQASILRCLGGETTDLGASEENRMSASDEAFYAATTRLSKRTTSNEQPLVGLFDDLLKVSDTTRWDVLHRGVHTIELATILDLKTRELGQNNKSKSKDQKALMQEMKDVRSNLKTQIKPLIGKLNGLIMDDREMDWAGVNGDLIEPEFVNGMGAHVTNNRVEAVEKLKSLLETL